MTTRRITRRDFVVLSGAVGATAAVAACAPAVPPAAPATQAPKPAAAAPTTPPAPMTAASKPAAPTAAPTVAAVKPVAATAAPAPAGDLTTLVVNTMPATFKESPMLAELVKGGKLAPVKERLPDEPLVLKPFHEIGVYGGTFRDGERSTDRFAPGFSSNIHPLNQPRGFLHFRADVKGYDPGIAKAWKVSDDKSTYTLTLRTGMKWSDGKPFTAKDVVFWYEDVLLNKELTPAVDANFRIKGEVSKFTAPDDSTLVIQHAGPHPNFLSILAGKHNGWGSYDQPFTPAHYLKPFHLKYNANANDEAKAEKYDSWVARFRDKMNTDLTEGVPTVRPYMAVSDSATVAKEDRNPYFWAVDVEGNQLPYIDHHEIEHPTGKEAWTAKAVTGAYDFGTLSMDILNYQAYKAGEKTGNYVTELWPRSTGNEVFYAFNLTHKDPELRQMFQDVRFRRAMSMAINRQEINEVIYFGQATPRQLTVVPYSKWYKPEYGEAYASHDLAKANGLLGELGLQWDADKKWRLRPNGQKFTLNIAQPLGSVPATQITELVADHWSKVGIELVQAPINQTLLQQRVPANEQDMTLWLGTNTTDVAFPINALWLVGNAMTGQENTVAILWNQWLETGGKQGEEPPAWWKDHYQTYRSFKETLDDKLAEKLLTLQADQVLGIGTIGMGPQPTLIRTNLRNVVGPKPIWGADFYFALPFHASTWYFKT